MYSHYEEIQCHFSRVKESIIESRGSAISETLEHGTVSTTISLDYLNS